MSALQITMYLYWVRLVSILFGFLAYAQVYFLHKALS